MLLDENGKKLSTGEVARLKSKYPGQTGQIDAHQRKIDGYYVDTRSKKKEVLFHKKQPIKGQKDGPGALQRKNFTKATTTAIPLTKGAGLHRRHIISSHLMKQAIENYMKEHPDRMDAAEGQTLLNRLNNYKNNLIPGPGAENTAIGMITNRTAGIQKGATTSGAKGTMDSRAFAANMGQSIAQPSGYQPRKQKELLDPVTGAFMDPSVSKSHGSVMGFARDIEVSTDFDWPDNADPKLFKTWFTIFEEFTKIKEKPENVTRRQFDRVTSAFLKLPNPVK